MKRNSWAVIAIVIILALLLPACSRSYSKAPIPSPTTSGTLPFPVPGTSAAQNSVNSATQTAIAVAEVLGPVSGQTQAVSSTEATAPLPPTNTPFPPTATPTFVKVATATPGLPTTYTIHEGEWPFCLARRFNIDPAALLEANGLNIDSRPEPGTQLQIPEGAPQWPAGSRSLIDHPALYTVAPGDTIYSIACEFGDVDPNAIISANHLQEPYTLTAGSTIQIP